MKRNTHHTSAFTRFHRKRTLKHTTLILHSLSRSSIQLAPWVALTRTGCSCARPSVASSVSLYRPCRRYRTSVGAVPAAWYRRWSAWIPWRRTCASCWVVRAAAVAAGPWTGCRSVARQGVVRHRLGCYRLCSSPRTDSSTLQVHKTMSMPQAYRSLG